ncbi:MAG: hypothetical protein N3A54_05970 [Patescibacteria group bacterium]|nr:hypothetical protein [Patescibacteria group bacterium]
MPQKKPIQNKNKTNKFQFDFQPWNFIIFIVLSLVLVVVVAATLQGKVTDLGIQAGFVCPRVSLRNPDECPQGWKVEYKQIDSRRTKCPILVCPTPSLPNQ